MSVMYPLAIVDAAPITSLVKMTLHHRSISVYHTKVEMNEGLAALGPEARNAAAKNPVTQQVSDIPGGRSVKNQMAIEGGQEQVAPRFTSLAARAAGDSFVAVKGG